MLDIEPRNRPTTAQVCLHPWMKKPLNEESLVSAKVVNNKTITENTSEKMTSADVKVRDVDSVKNKTMGKSIADVLSKYNLNSYFSREL